MDEYPHREATARRTGARILDTAEGVLAALRRCRVDRAFVELMQTAKQHGVNPVKLADALVAVAEDRFAKDVDGVAAAVARATWGHLLGVNEQAGAAAEGHPKPSATSLESADSAARTQEASEFD